MTEFIPILEQCRVNDLVKSEKERTKCRSINKLLTQAVLEEAVCVTVATCFTVELLTLNESHSVDVNIRRLKEGNIRLINVNSNYNSRIAKEEEYYHDI